VRLLLPAAERMGCIGVPNAGEEEGIGWDRCFLCWRKGVRGGGRSAIFV